MTRPALVPLTFAIVVVFLGVCIALEVVTDVRVIPPDPELRAATRFFMGLFTGMLSGYRLSTNGVNGK